MSISPSAENYELQDATLNGVRGEGCAYSDLNLDARPICGVFLKALDETEDLTQILHKGRVDFRGIFYDQINSRKVKSKHVCMPVNIQFVTRKGGEERAIFEADPGDRR